MKDNFIVPYLEGAFRTAITSYLVRGKISERQIDFVKEIVYCFKEAEIEHTNLLPAEKKEQKLKWKLWIEATAQGVKDELKAEGKLE